MGVGYLAQAWALLRLDRDYRAAWRTHAARPVCEDGKALPVRIRCDADRIAARDWGLMAWEDPDGDAVSAFFDTPMLEGEGSATAPPLLAMLEKAGAHVEACQNMRLARDRHRIRKLAEVGSVSGGPSTGLTGTGWFGSWSTASATGG